MCQHCQHPLWHPFNANSISFWIPFSPSATAITRGKAPPSHKNSGVQKKQPDEDVTTKPQFLDILIRTQGQVSQIKPVWEKSPGLAPRAIGYSVSPPARDGMKDFFPPCSLIRDSLACHQSNGATNTAACRDERKGFPKTPDCSIKQERHTGREIEEEE